MSATSVQRDERTAAVENASYRWGYLVMSFGVLVLVMYRSFARDESNWDLLALVVGGGIVTSVYQGANRCADPGMGAHLGCRGGRRRHRGGDHDVCALVGAVALRTERASRSD